MSDSGFRRVFRLPGRRGRVARDVDEELEFHLAMRREDLERDGWKPEDAAREAARQFGDTENVRRACRRESARREGEMRMSDMAGMMLQDVRFAFRQFVKQPLVSGLAVVTLALGIGATAVVFSVVDAVVLGAVPLPDVDRLVVVPELTPQGATFSSSEPNFLDWRDRQRSFEDIGAYSFGDKTLTGGSEAIRLSGMRVSHSALAVLGLDPVLGRHILAEEDVPGGEARVVLLSERFWERMYGAAQDVVGETVQLDGESHVVLGVVPTDDAFPGVEIFTPLAPNPASDRGNHMIETVGRLAEGVTLESAREDMARIAGELAAEYPDPNSGWGATTIPFREWRVGEQMTRVGVFLLGAVALLLLMACGSVSNILIARATARQREMGLRAALGAGRRRIVGQLVTESAVLGIAGVGLGVVLAWWGLPLVRALGPSDLERLARATLDRRVLSVSALAGGFSVLVFGLVPAWFVTKARLFDALREGVSTGGGGNRRLRDTLVVAQFALAIMVVLGAGLMVRSFSQLQDVELGFRPAGSLQFALSLPDARFSVVERVVFLYQLKEQMAGLPGVEAVGVTMSSPFSDFRASNHVAAADNMPDRQEDFPPVSWRAVDEGFFDALDIDVVAGRTFLPEDGIPEGGPPEDWEPSTVIDATLAEELWGTVDVVGRQVVWSDPGGMTLRIVGVVAATRDEYVDGPPRPRIYLHYDMFPWPEPWVLVRSAGDPTLLVPAVRELVAGLDADVPMTDVAAVSSTLRNAVAWPRFTMQVLSAFGLIAMLLAAMGIYGVTAFGVTRRRREIGIRVALGAESAGVVRLILKRALRLAALGIVGGLLASLAAAGFLDTLLYEVEPTDPLTFLGVPLLLGVVALAATWWPAVRATRIDPREALSAE